MKKYLTTKEVAEELRVTPYTVRRYINSGELKAYKLKEWRIKPEDLERFIETKSN